MRRQEDCKQISGKQEHFRVLNSLPKMTVKVNVEMYKQKTKACCRMELKGLEE